MERPDARTPEEMREITFLPGVAPHATGSVLACFGNTKVLCSAKIERGVPNWMKYQKVAGGWLTATYNMLPYSTLERKQRDGSQGRIDGRSSEIQRLIGRSLRAVVDLKKLGERTLWIDCDVLQADGGTRTTSVTGACVAVAIAFDKLLMDATLKTNPLKTYVAAVSAGVYGGTPILDLCYLEDRDASVDFNMVLTEDLQFVELQGSGEEATFSPEELNSMLELGRAGVEKIVELQKAAVEAALKPATTDSLADLASHFGGDSRPSSS